MRDVSPFSLCSPFEGPHYEDSSRVIEGRALPLKKSTFRCTLKSTTSRLRSRSFWPQFQYECSGSGFSEPSFATSFLFSCFYAVRQGFWRTKDGKVNFSRFQTTKFNYQASLARNRFACCSSFPTKIATFANTRVLRIETTRIYNSRSDIRATSDDFGLLSTLNCVEYSRNYSNLCRNLSWIFINLLSLVFFCGYKKIYITRCKVIRVTINL